MRANLWLLRSNFLFSVALDPHFPPGIFGWGWIGDIQCSAISGLLTALMPLPFWSSLICVGLVEVTMVANVHLIYQSC